jgi:mannose-6-phosphate isomerase-like protein (cupin superfamily)
MTVDGTPLVVRPGDVIVNRPGGTHGLRNTGVDPLRLVVVDVAVGGEAG